MYPEELRNQQIIVGLLAELVDAEKNLSETDRKLKEVEARFEVASRKYVAIRDMVSSYLGYSPYLLPEQQWPEPKEEVGFFGFYRFIGMKTGEAAVAALREASGAPLSLEAIVEILRDGGLRPISGLTRIVNAALMRTSGIKKTRDGTYYYEEQEEVATEELPF